MPRSARRPAPPAAEPAPVVLEPRVWQGVVYQPCQSGAPEVRQLFHFAGAFAPDLEPGEIAWEARAGGRIVGGVLCERRGAHGFIHGPVVVDPPAGTESIEVAAQLVSPIVDSARAIPLGAFTAWARSGITDTVQLLRGVIESLT